MEIRAMATAHGYFDRVREAPELPGYRAEVLHIAHPLDDEGWEKEQDIAQFKCYIGNVVAETEQSDDSRFLRPDREVVSLFNKLLSEWRRDTILSSDET